MNQAPELDDFDKKILRALQDNADYSMAELGEKVGLSHTPCWRRIKRLEADGIIQKRVTLLNAEKLNLGVAVHAYITIKDYTEEALTAFEDAIATLPEIVECYSLSGKNDYLLKVVVDGVKHYEKILKQQIMQLPNVAAVNSTFALRQIKYTTQLPL